MEVCVCNGVMCITIQSLVELENRDNPLFSALSISIILNISPAAPASSFGGII